MLNLAAGLAQRTANTEGALHCTAGHGRGALPCVPHLDSCWEALV